MREERGIWGDHGGEKQLPFRTAPVSASLLPTFRILQELEEMCIKCPIQELNDC